MQGFTVAARTDVDTISSLPDCEDIIDKFHPTSDVYNKNQLHHSTSSLSSLQQKIGNNDGFPLI